MGQANLVSWLREAALSDEPDNFINWLNGFLDGTQVRKSCRVYGVGTYGRYTVFPQLTPSGEIHDAKLMAYDADGHRIKGDKSFNWLSNLIGHDVPELSYGFFGGHLIGKHPDKAINIVESEKTAIVASIEYPDEIWVASGGLSYLGITKPSKRASALSGRKVYLWPDKGAERTWDTTAKVLGEVGCDAECLHWFPDDEEGLPDGYDLADWIYRVKIASLCDDDKEELQPSKSKIFQNSDITRNPDGSITFNRREKLMQDVKPGVRSIIDLFKLIPEQDIPPNWKADDFYESETTGQFWQSREKQDESYIPF